MDCYAHTGVPAAAVCRACGKGVCRRCAIEIPFGVVCSPACEPFARSLIQLQQQSIRSIGNLRVARLMQPAIAVIFLGCGSYMLANGGYGITTLMLLLMGGAILGAWVWTHGRGR